MALLSLRLYWTMFGIAPKDKREPVVELNSYADKYGGRTVQTTVTSFRSGGLEEHHIAVTYAFRNHPFKKNGVHTMDKERVSMINGISLPRLTTRLLLTFSLMALLVVAIRPVFPATSTTVTLGSAASFAVLGGSTVTNTGPTVITGGLGVSPGSAITGFPPGTVSGGIVHAGDAVASQAHTALSTLYNSLKGMPCGTNLTGQNLGGMTLSPGVYCFNSSAQLTGILHLNGPANAVYVFQIGSTLTTASNSMVIVNNNICGSNVYWQIGSSATIGTDTMFAGNIVALTSITITTNATISGRALALNGAVTMDTNHITACGAGTHNGGPCGEDTETGDTHQHDGNNSLKDSHDTDDNHVHHLSDHDHDDHDACSSNHRDNDHRVQDTDSHDDED